MTVTLDWFGCTTYRLDIDGLIVFLDTFMDRLSSAPDTGATTADITEADYALIGHSHMDHLAGADIIAKNTGAKIIGSHETARVLVKAGVPVEQLLRSAGGEMYRLNDRVTVRTYPSLHSCIWSTAAPAGVRLTGDLGVDQDERNARLASSSDDDGGLPPELAAEQAELDKTRIGSSSDGGALDYLIDTPHGSIFFQNSMGYYSGVLEGIRADVLVMGCAGRGNIDGEPIQGSVEDYVEGVVTTVDPDRVVLGHHDNWAGDPHAPDFMDITPIRERLEEIAPDTEVIEPGYRDGTRLL